jgi:hypothetical protein
MLLARYNNIEFVLSMHWVDGLQMITKAFEKDVEDKLYNRWLHENPHLEKPLNFTDFKEQLLPKKDVDKNRKIDQDDLEKRMKNFKRRKTIDKGGRL